MTIIQVDSVPVFSVLEVKSALQAIDISVHGSLSLVVAPYHPDPKAQHALLPQIALDQLTVIHCHPRLEPCRSCALGDWQRLMSFICASVINHDITKVMGQ
jgi:hypothetical protein